MMKKYGAAIAACGLLLIAAAPAVASQVEIEIPVYEVTRDRDDRDASPAQMAADACRTGLASIAVAHAPSGCAIAYDIAIQARNFDEALRFATTGCEKYLIATDCGRALRVPLLMGTALISVPPRYAEEIKRLAEFVCLSGAQLRPVNGRRANGRECANFARQFVLAGDPGYRHAWTPPARQYLETVYDPMRAAQLYRAACNRFHHQDACAHRQHIAGKAY